MEIWYREEVNHGYFRGEGAMVMGKGKRERNMREMHKNTSLNLLAWNKRG